MRASSFFLGHDFTYDRIHSKVVSPLKRTKIICTIGPASESVEMLKGLIDGGMTIARLNFSHGSHESHFRLLQNIKEAIAQTNSEGRVGIMLDTKGPEIRTGFFKNGNKVVLKKGNMVTIWADYTLKGDSQNICLSYPNFVKNVKIGTNILIADGNLILVVERIDIEKECVTAYIQNDFELGERKNVNLPGVVVDLPVITEKDRHDIVNFGVKHQVDYVALSFTRTKECVQRCREVLGKEGRKIQIIPKIENEEGLENLEAIVDASDGIMMARGDLGMELNPSKLLIAQKFMTKMCRMKGKPVICATQMLESMTKNARPTRAEMSDVGNAVLDSVDCVMLSGETGSGMFVLESLQMMANICKEVEQSFDYSKYSKIYRKLYKNNLKDEHQMLTVLGNTSLKMAQSLDLKCIIVIDSSDIMINKLSRLRGRPYLIFPSPNVQLLRSLSLKFGVFAVPCNSNQDIDMIESARRFILNHQLSKVGERVVLVSSVTHQVKLEEL